MLPSASLLAAAAIASGGLTYDFGAVSAKLRSAGDPSNTVVSVRNSIPDALDGTFALSKDQLGIYQLEWRQNVETNLDATKLRIEVRLPRGVGLVACNFADLRGLTRVPAKDGGEYWSIEPRHGLGRFMPDLPPKGKFAAWIPFMFVLEPKGTAVDLGRGEFCVSYGGKRVSNVERVGFRLLPKIAAKAPKRLWSGFNVSSCTFDFHDAAVMDRLAEFWAEAGMRWITWPRWMSRDGVDDGAITALRKAGFTKLVPHDCSLCDGYQVGPGYVRPRNERFVTDAKGVWYDGAICPIAVYTRMPYLKEYFEKGLPKLTKGVDGMWSNWEPYPAAKHGCWCEKCRAAFAAFAGLSADEVKSVWPEELKKDDGKHADAYIAFRAKEHAKVVRTVDRRIRELIGEESIGFLPGVAWCEMTSEYRRLIDAKKTHRYMREQSTVEYSKDLEWIAPWGPYPRWESETRYKYEKCRYLTYFVAAKDVKDQLDRDCGPGKAPKLMATPSGSQGAQWVSQPEHVAIAYDSFYFNGWRAVAPYYFPKGYDARYWAAIAKSTSRAAKYEDFLLDGRRVDERVEARPVAEYAMPCAAVTKWLPAVTNVSPLQIAAYRLGERTIVGAFNFWEKGEAFFDLKVKGLESGRYWVLDEDGVLYAKDGKNTSWTAGELASDGIRLAVGIVRARVFEIVPEGECASGEIVTRAELDRRFEECRPRLAEAAAKDAAEELERRRKRTPPPET